MSQQNLVVLIFYGITILQLDVISSTTEWKYEHPLVEDTSQYPLDDQIRIALLPDTGGKNAGVRYRREAATEIPAQESSSTPDLPRGYHQPADIDREKVIGEIDISEDNFKNKFSSNNITMMKNETTKYYEPTFMTNGSRYFVNLDAENTTEPHRGKVMEHTMLSKSYRRAATVTLNFSFPFYGHDVENITIATGGFLYTGDYVHSWLAATQYIAPLMANFDTSNNKEAKIRYLDTGEVFIVEWKDVYLQEKEDMGPFTFQVHLNNSGDILFAYERIPLSIETIKDEEHPVKVGLSDAYIIDRTIFFVKRKTIYEYHRVNMKSQNIGDHTAILFKALFTCNQQTDCASCVKDRGAGDNGKNLDCGWCPALNRCSDGMDRKRQDWLNKNCDKQRVTEDTMCEASINPDDNLVPAPAGDQEARSALPDTGHRKKSAISPGAITAIIFFILLITAAFSWTGYAYFFPHSASGQFLIKNRPGAWRWRMGGTRYTAASSIHM